MIGTFIGPYSFIKLTLLPYLPPENSCIAPSNVSLLRPMGGYVLYILYQSFCAVVYLGPPTPYPPQASVGELPYFTGSGKTERGEAIFAIFEQERECGPVGDPNHTTAQKLRYSIYYSLYVWLGKEIDGFERWVVR